MTYAEFRKMRGVVSVPTQSKRKAPTQSEPVTEPSLEMPVMEMAQKPARAVLVSEPVAPVAELEPVIPESAPEVEATPEVIAEAVKKPRGRHPKQESE